jgi:hypothetical protein
LVSTEIKTATNDSHDQEYGIPGMQIWVTMKQNVDLFYFLVEKQKD